ncbi:DUF3786 domain-containing protein [Sporomusa malonica]|uniref:DUF3786 domain-containing protein n=1 Tax=Sporomusa malonica TaxID=112901 RepID=A0A1W2E666_9FIRM|nr:DUF3786 domain-containing protein [Sporomusa malonica]SMD05224.1 protein of unknown function [Sporomusa malonica]
MTGIKFKHSLLCTTQGGIYLETNYRIAYDKGWDDLKQKTPEDIASTMDVTYLSDKQQFIVPYLNENYIADCIKQTIHKEADGTVPGIGAAILILHYLTFFQTETALVNKWVSLKEIPNGGMLFYPAFHKESIVGLIKAFGHQPSLLLECAKQIGGQPARFGDASAVFKVFPKIPLCVVIWEGDEEIAANATVLFDPSIEHLLHIESVIGLGGYLANKLIKLAAPETRRGHEIW